MGTIYRHIDNVPTAKARALTVGSFDGVHRGHRALIRRVVDEGERRGISPLLLTFDPHPRCVISPERPARLLLTPEEELDELQRVYTGDILVLKFDQAMMNLTAEDFVGDILFRRLNAQVLVAGENHAVGRGRKGDVGKLGEIGKNLGFELVVVPPVMHTGKVVSSSAIRNCIEAGQIAEANELWDSRYALTGTVVRGIGLGKKIGFPTANLKVDARKILPLEGVYATEVEVAGDSHTGMLFVGKNHMDPHAAFSVEAFIFNFCADIYGARLRYIPLWFLRPNRWITDIAGLTRQLAEDREKIENRLSHKEKKSVHENA